MTTKTTTDPHDANEIPHGPMIGAYKNLWRMRAVIIYEHPTAPATRVITCGIPLADHGAGPLPDLKQPRIWTDEPREDFARYIGTYNRVYE
jgi:hypothetical protein